MNTLGLNPGKNSKLIITACQSNARDGTWDGHIDKREKIF